MRNRIPTIPHARKVPITGINATIIANNNKPNQASHIIFPLLNIVIIIITECWYFYNIIRFFNFV